jgi:hypothetical protein
VLKRSLILLMAASTSLLSPVMATAQTDGPPGSTDSGGGNTDTPGTTFGTNNDDGTLDASVGTTGSNSGGGSPGPASFGPSCTWTPATIGNTAGTPGVDNPADAGGQVTNEAGELGWIRNCGGNVDFVWSTPVDPIDLIGPAAARARQQLPDPDPIINPTAEVGGIVNLGLWHSIAQPATTTARATLGGAWAEVTGTFSQLTIDPGDGTEPFDCEGLGEPYPEGTNNPDEGPCGNTYTQSSPEDDPYRITYTNTYTITWRTSDGRSGTLDSYPRRITIDYDVDEIQTVGSG